MNKKYSKKRVLSFLCVLSLLFSNFSGVVVYADECEHVYSEWTIEDETNHKKTCQLCNDTVRENHIDNDGDSFCDVCDFYIDEAPSCTHDDESLYSYENNYDGTHKVFCGSCGGTLINANETCIDEDFDDYCDKCGATLLVCNPHINTSNNTYIDETNHPGQHIYTCDNCGATFGEWENCIDSDSNGYCDICNQVIIVCSHLSKIYTYNNDGTHKVSCEDCGEELVSSEACIDENQNGYCDKCNHLDPSTCIHSLINYYSNDNGTHYGFCASCNQEIVSVEDCEDGDSDNYCDKCGYDMSTSSPSNTSIDTSTINNIKVWPITLNIKTVDIHEPVKNIGFYAKTNDNHFILQSRNSLYTSQTVESIKLFYFYEESNKTWYLCATDDELHKILSSNQTTITGNLETYKDAFNQGSFAYVVPSIYGISSYTDFSNTGSTSRYGSSPTWWIIQEKYCFNLDADDMGAPSMIPSSLVKHYINQLGSNTTNIGLFKNREGFSLYLTGTEGTDYTKYTYTGQYGLYGDYYTKPLVSSDLVFNSDGTIEGDFTTNTFDLYFYQVDDKTKVTFDIYTYDTFIDGSMDNVTKLKTVSVDNSFDFSYWGHNWQNDDTKVAKFFELTNLSPDDYELINYYDYGDYGRTGMPYNKRFDNTNFMVFLNPTTPTTYNYEIHYFFDDVEDVSKKETGSKEANEIVNATSYANDIYELDNSKTATTSLTISTDESNNILNVYYKTKVVAPTTYNYEIHYFFDDVEDIAKKETGSKEVNEVINATSYASDTYELDNSKTTTTSLTISTDESNNILNVYYKTKVVAPTTYSYEIHYFFDNVEDAAKKVVGSDIEGKVINATNYADAIYELDTTKTSSTSLTISTTAGNNILNIYYKTKVIAPSTSTITVKFYLDNVLQLQKNDIEGIVGATITDLSQHYTIPANVSLDKVEGLPLVVNADSSKNVCAYYYKTNKYAYEIHYYFDDVEDTSKKEVGSATAGSNIVRNKTFSGYELISSKTSLTISTDESKNVLNIYYKTKISTPSIPDKEYAKFVVETYLDGKLKESNTYEYEVGKVISTVPYTKPNNSSLNKVETLPITVSSDSSKNIVRVYFVTNPIESATIVVNTYIDSILSDTKTFSANVGTRISEVNSYYTLAKGTKLDRIDKLPMEVKSGQNIVNVYLVSKNTTKNSILDVETYIDGELSTKEQFTLPIGTTINELGEYVRTPGGAKLDEIDKLPLTINEGTNLLKVYYVTKEETPIEEPTNEEEIPSEEEPTPDDDTPDEDIPNEDIPQEDTKEEDTPKKDNNIPRTVAKVLISISIPGLLAALLLFTKEKWLLLLIPPKKQKEKLYGIWLGLEGATYEDMEGNQITITKDEETGKLIFLDREGTPIEGIITNEEYLEKLNTKEISYLDFKEYLATNNYLTIVDSDYKLQATTTYSNNAEPFNFEETALNQDNVTTILDLYADMIDVENVSLTFITPDYQSYTFDFKFNN